MNLAYRWILPLAGLLILLVISLGFNYFLVKRYRHVYRELSRVTLDPLGLNQFQTDPDEEVRAGEGKVVLFYGDSRAAAWPSPETTGLFVFVNRGVNGQTAAQASLRYPLDGAPLRPDVVVLQAGINDLRVIPALPGERGAVVAATEASLRQLVDQARADSLVVVVTTIFPVQTPPWSERMFWSAEVMGAVTAVNHTIRSLAADDVLVLDAYALLADEQGALRDEYAADYLHINAAGYRELNKLLLAYLPELSGAPDALGPILND